LISENASSREQATFGPNKKILTKLFQIMDLAYLRRPAQQLKILICKNARHMQRIDVVNHSDGRAAAQVDKTSTASPSGSAMCFHRRWRIKKLYVEH
jgi:hypothetical protein